MTRSIYVIAGLGAVGCVVMSMMMQHALKVTKDKKVPQAVADIHDLYGSRLRQMSAIEVTETPDHTRLQAALYPSQSTGNDRLAGDIGNFLWRRYAVRQIVDEVVVVVHEPGAEAVEVSVPAPMLARRKLRPAPPAPPPAPAEVPARVPPGAGR